MEASTVDHHRQLTRRAAHDESNSENGAALPVRIGEIRVILGSIIYSMDPR